jgi:hypothetical protein
MHCTVVRSISIKGTGDGMPPPAVLPFTHHPWLLETDCTAIIEALPSISPANAIWRRLCIVVFFFFSIDTQQCHSWGIFLVSFENGHTGSCAQVSQLGSTS